MNMSRTVNYINVRNDSEFDHDVRHALLPGGRLTHKPGEIVTYHRTVYTSCVAKQLWAKNVDTEAVMAGLPVAAEETEAIEIPEDLVGLKMAELREKAAEIELTIPVGISKADAAILIGTARKEVKNEEV